MAGSASTGAPGAAAGADGVDGPAGIDLGGVHDYATFTRILNRAAEIGESWIENQDNLCWAPENGFYLYDQEGERAALEPGKATLSLKAAVTQRSLRSEFVSSEATVHSAGTPSGAKL